MQKQEGRNFVGEKIPGTRDGIFETLRRLLMESPLSMRVAWNSCRSSSSGTVSESRAVDEMPEKIPLTTKEKESDFTLPLTCTSNKVWRKLADGCSDTLFSELDEIGAMLKCYTRDLTQRITGIRMTLMIAMIEISWTSSLAGQEVEENQSCHLLQINMQWHNRTYALICSPVGTKARNPSKGGISKLAVLQAYIFLDT